LAQIIIIISEEYQNLNKQKAHKQNNFKIKTTNCVRSGNIIGNFFLKIDNNEGLFLSGESFLHFLWMNENIHVTCSAVSKSIISLVDDVVFIVPLNYCSVLLYFVPVGGMCLCFTFNFSYFLCYFKLAISFTKLWCISMFLLCFDGLDTLSSL